MSVTHNYSPWVLLCFWLMWLTGCAVCLLFSVSILFTWGGVSPIGVLSALVILVELVLLFRLARHCFRADMSGSALLLWVALTAIGIPLLATGGCIMLSNPGNWN